MVFQLIKCDPKTAIVFLNYGAHCQMLVQSVAGFVQFSPYQVVMTMDYP